jgi:NADP-dependent 3-hydroxy acid dehydrogenase YdfG
MASASVAIAAFAKENGVDVRTVELDVLSQDSVDAAVSKVIGESGRIDVLIHNAGHMVFGPAEAFTPEQLAQLYDVNVLSTQRVNRAVLPHLRRQKQGLVVWVSSSVQREHSSYVGMAASRCCSKP